MSIFEQIELEDKVMKLCRTLHEKLCSEEQDLDESIMTPEEVNQLEPIEALKHMTEAIKDLLSHQRNVQYFQEYKNFNNHEAVQVTLQKLEGDIREHIKIENQLKLYCENLETCIEETEKSTNKLEIASKKMKEELDKENCLLKEEFMMLENEVNQIKGESVRKNETNNLDTEATREPEAEVQAENEQKNLLIIDKCLKIKKLKEIARNKEFLCKEMAKENKNMMDLIKTIKADQSGKNLSKTEYFKIQYKEKSNELMILKQRLTMIEKGPTKSHSPISKPIKDASPISKRSVSNTKKKSVMQTQIKSHKSLYRTLQDPISRL